MYYHFFVAHPQAVQRMCGWRRSDRPFGRQRPSKVAKIVKNRRFCRFKIRLVRPGRLSYRLGTHIPGFPGPLCINTILQNFFPIPSLAVTNGQSRLSKSRRKNAKKWLYFNGRLRPNRPADRPDRRVPDTSWPCLFRLWKKIRTPPIEIFSKKALQSELKSKKNFQFFRNCII